MGCASASQGHHGSLGHTGAISVLQKGSTVHVHSKPPPKPVQVFLSDVKPHFPIRSPCYSKILPYELCLARLFYVHV